MKANASPRKTLARDEQAVSPVVATLLLVLVAAGAAIGFGVFLNGFQKSTQSQVQTGSAKEVLRVAGSTTVTPIIQSGLESFQAANKGLSVEVSAVGSGSGIRAVCSGNAEIGMSSKPFGVEDGVSTNQVIPGADQKTCPDFNHDGVRDAGVTFQLFPIAIDGIVLITKDTSHCAGGLSFTQDVVQELYAQNLDAQNGGSRVGAGISGKLSAEAAGVAYKWTDLLVACGGSPATGGNAILVLQRFDAGGTEDAFCTLMMIPTPTTSNANCSSGELKLAGTKDVTAFDGNTALENAVLGNADALSFMSYGFAKTSSAKMAKFGNTGAPQAPGDSNMKNGARGIAGGYEAARKIWVFTAGAPSSSAQLFIDFYVNNAAQNKQFANANGFLGINE